MSTTKEYNTDYREVVHYFESAPTPLRLAKGTREIEPLPLPQPMPRASSPLLLGSDDLSLQSIPDAVFMIDMNSCIVDVNERAEALVGYDRNELVGRLLAQVIANLESSVPTNLDQDEHTRFLPAGTGAYAVHRTGATIPVDALICLAQSSPRRGAVYNLCTGVQTSLATVVETARTLMRIPVEPVWSSMPQRSWDTDIWVGSPAAMETEIGWRAGIDFTTGLRRMIDWFISYRAV